jgi:hypothetical protein
MACGPFLLSLQPLCLPPPLPPHKDPVTPSDPPANLGGSPQLRGCVTAAKLSAVESGTIDSQAPSRVRTRHLLWPHWWS